MDALASPLPPPTAVLVDSSVWIDWLRGGRSASAVRLISIGRDAQILVADLVLLEVLQGARDDLHAAAIALALEPFGRVQIMDVAIAVEAARNYRTLRARGITLRKTADLIIGTWCIAHDIALLHDDRDFEPMREHLGLRVA
jgi:predicted nucleic acid-binding protein